MSCASATDRASPDEPNVIVSILNQPSFPEDQPGELKPHGGRRGSPTLPRLLRSPAWRPVTLEWEVGCPAETGLADNSPPCSAGVRGGRVAARPRIHGWELLMIRKAARYVLAVVVMAVGLTLVSATPALAVGACNSSNATVGPCIDYGGGSTVRADFYLKRGPDGAIYSYRLAIVVNGREHVKVDTKTRLTGQGRYCCWTQHVDGLPDRRQTAFTRVWIYNSGGALHLRQDSPSITFTA